jgi:hypothetical protein
MLHEGITRRGSLLTDGRAFAPHLRRWYQVAAVHFAWGRLRTLGTRPPGHGAAVTVFSRT